MGSKNSPNSVAMAAFLLWQIGSGTVKREKRQSRLIERRKKRITQGLNAGRVERYMVLMPVTGSIIYNSSFSSCGKGIGRLKCSRHLHQC